MDQKPNFFIIWINISQHFLIKLANVEYKQKNKKILENKPQNALDERQIAAVFSEEPDIGILKQLIQNLIHQEQNDIQILFQLRIFNNHFQEIMKGYIPIIALLLLIGLTASLSLQSDYTHYASSFSFLKGTQLTFVKDVKPVTINYRNWGAKSAEYNLRIYKSPVLNADVNVFVASNYTFEETITIDENVQFGVEKGVIFLVKHGAQQRKVGIYQWRFTQAAGGLTLTKNAAVAANKAFSNFMKSKGVSIDLSWIAGDPLRNF